MQRGRRARFEEESEVIVLLFLLFKIKDMDFRTDENKDGFAVPLRAAAEKGQRNIETATGENFGTSSRRKRVASMVTTNAGKISSVKMLAEFGADLNYISKDGTTPACKERNYDMVHLLLKAGANPNIGRDGNGRATLMLEISPSPEHVVDILLQYKSDTEIKNKEG
ncbi:hypothetical protein TWF730_005007 [Orbilia blumenaviensis]|uniref:Ankyrin repeat protein n=1 Tax=Orbilia blumenaviensis TaxID=1796055 RepID=A0AAV9VJF8_9PEZI